MIVLNNGLALSGEAESVIIEDDGPFMRIRTPFIEESLYCVLRQ